MLNVLNQSGSQSFSTNGDSGTNVELSVSLLDESKHVLSSQSGLTVYNVSDWRSRPTALHIGKRMQQFLEMPDRDSFAGSIPYVMNVSHFGQNEIKDGVMFLHLTASDHIGKSTVEFDREIEVHKQ